MLTRFWTFPEIHPLITPHLLCHQARTSYEIQEFAKVFVDMQSLRHSADYDPDATFHKSKVVHDIADAEDITNLFNSVPRRDRRVFAIYVVLGIGRSG